MSHWNRRCSPLLPMRKNPEWSDNRWLAASVAAWQLQQPSLEWDGARTDDPERLTPDNTTFVADRPDLTRYAGMPLFIAFTQKLGLAAALKKHLCFGKRESRFSVVELGECVVDAIVCGIERIEHTNLLKHDPVLAAARGLAQLPDHATHHRYLTSFQEAHVGQLAAAARELFQQVNRPAGKRRVDVCLDFDATAACVYGEQEQAAFGHYHRKDGHRELSLLMGFVGNTGDALGVALRGGDRHSNYGALAFVQENIQALPAGMQARWLRLDSGFFDTETMRWCEDQPEPLEYVIGMPVTQALHQAAAAKAAPWRRLSKDIEVCDFEYDFAVDRRTRRVLLTRHPDPKKTKEKAGQPSLFRRDAATGEYPAEAYTYFAAVTNNRRRSANALWQWYAGRATLENSLKEAKLGFGLERLPSKRFWANAAYAWFVLLAYNLVNWFKRLLLAAEEARRQVKSLRHWLLGVPGALERTAQGWVLHLPQGHPSLPWFVRIQQRLATVRAG